MKYLVSPSSEEALEILLASRSSAKKSMSTIIGRCKVEYSGRAKSFLDYGDRLVIIKPDGTIMVHGDAKREPLNWQPPGTKISFSLDGGLAVSARRTSPVETMRLHFMDIHAISVFRLEDYAELNLVGEESELVDRIERDPSIIEPGLRVVRREKTTDSGYIDLFCQDSTGNTVIVEVKRTQISPSAVHQLEAYLIDFRKKSGGMPVRGILCAPKISGMARTLAGEKGIEYRQIEQDFELKERRQRSLDSFCDQSIPQFEQLP